MTTHDLFDFLMSDAGTIIVTGSGPLHAEVMAALMDAQKQGITVIFREDPPPMEILAIQLMPPMPEINFAALKRTHAERATPNQPWYAKFQKRRRRNS